jgi:hypothetical protein
MQQTCAHQHPPQHVKRHDGEHLRYLLGGGALAGVVDDRPHRNAGSLDAPLPAECAGVALNIGSVRPQNAQGKAAELSVAERLRP